jgi:hypothetical protein
VPSSASVGIATPISLVAKAPQKNDDHSVIVTSGSLAFIGRSCSNMTVKVKIVDCGKHLY